MKYVDSFVIPVPKKNLAVYSRMAAVTGKVWKKYGALKYVECVADDVKPGKRTSFPQSVKLKKDVLGRVQDDHRSLNGKSVPGTRRSYNSLMDKSPWMERPVHVR